MAETGCGGASSKCCAATAKPTLYKRLRIRLSLPGRRAGVGQFPHADIRGENRPARRIVTFMQSPAAAGVTAAAADAAAIALLT